jgi:ribosomal protein S27E
MYDHTGTVRCDTCGEEMPDEQCPHPTRDHFMGIDTAYDEATVVIGCRRCGEVLSIVGN